MFQIGTSRYSFEVTNCDLKKRVNSKLEVTICDFKLGGAGENEDYNENTLVFEYYMFDCPVNRKDDSPVKIMYGNVNGFGWPGPRIRWCTKTLKTEPRERFLKGLKEHYEMRYYVGLAADEGYRFNRKNNQQANHVHPLVDWNMTEADCLKYCYDRGYDWGGLYEHFKRVSCWCCPLQSLEELRNLRKYYPEQWAKLLEWEKHNFRNFRADYSVDELDKRFAFEEECLAKGMKISGKEFHALLKEILISVKKKIENPR